MSKSTLHDIFDELDDIIPEKPKAVIEAAPILTAVKSVQADPQVQPIASAPVDINEAMKKLKEIEADLNSKFYEREEAIKVMMVALISKMSVFFVGTPGTGR